MILRKLQIIHLLKVKYTKNIRIKIFNINKIIYMNQHNKMLISKTKLNK